MTLVPQTQLLEHNVQWRPTSPPSGRAWRCTLVGMRNYIVVANDPDNSWRSAYVTVPALSRTDARDRARAELAKDRRDDWSISIVVEAS